MDQTLGKNRQKPGFSIKFKEAAPKAEVLERPQLYINVQGINFFFFITEDTGKETSVSSMVNLNLNSYTKSANS
jgi:hypothetical protein